MTSVLNQTPPSGTLPYGDVVYVDDGSDPLGAVEQLTGGSNSRNIPRMEITTYDPRLLSDSSPPTDGSFGDKSSKFIEDLSSAIDPSNPVQSVSDFIVGHPGEFRQACSELSTDPTLQAISQGLADRGLKPTQAINKVVQSGIGAGVLGDAVQVAAANGLISGTGVVGIEAGAVALTAGAIALDYDGLTGTHSFHAVAGHIQPLFNSFANKSKQDSTF